MRAFRLGVLAPLLAVLLAGSALPALAADATKPAADAAAVPQNDDLDATLWDQTSVEAKAASIGEYALGQIRLDQALADKSWTAANQTGDYQNLPPAIILDIDDTVLNTSAYQAWTVVSGNGYSGKTWDAYTKAGKDVPIAGVLPFLNYAASKGVAIFYSTNRTAAQEAPTVAEMKALGFPMGSGTPDSYLGVGSQPGWTSAKGSRTAYVAKSYRVLLMFGDNMGDFTDEYTGSVAERDAVYQKDMAHWGHDWIAIANPTYGSWQSAPFLSDYKDNNEDQQRQKEEQALHPWSGPAQ